MFKYLLFIVLAVLVVWVASIIKPQVTGTASNISEAQPRTEAAASSTGANENNIQNSMIKGLTVQDIKVGTGAEAQSGDLVTVDYVGTLTNGTVFDASKNHGTTGFTFPLGQGQVIKGWDLGVVGMKVGGVRKLTIAPELAYGNQAVGGVIPANSTLVFEVTLLNVRTQ